VLLLVALLMIVSLAPRRTSSVTVEDHTALSVSRLAVNVLVIKHNLLGELAWPVEASFVACLCPLPKLLLLLVNLGNSRLHHQEALPLLVQGRKMKLAVCAKVPLIFLQ
jgi:hypothetical protein